MTWQSIAESRPVASGAIFELGNTVNLGAGGTLDNSGTITAGRLGSVGTTNLTGTLNQEVGRTLQVDYQPGGAGDGISVARVVATPRSPARWRRIPSACRHATKLPA